MIVWAILTIMTALAAVIAAAPFLRSANRDASQPSEASASNLEAHTNPILRWLFARLGDRAPAALGVATVVAVSATLLYAGLERPDLPAVPAPGSGARSADEASSATGSALDDLKNYLKGASPAANPDGRTTAAASSESSGSEPPAGAAAGSVDEMIDRLAQRLKTKPADPEGWRMLGWSYASQERFAEAAEAYAKAIELNPGSGALKTARAEALVRQAGGTVAEDAAALFTEAVRQDGRDVRARYFLGLKKSQAGDKAAALEDWLAVLKDAEPGDAAAADVRQQALSLALELKVDISARLPAEAALAPAPAARGGILDKLTEGATSQSPPPSPPGELTPDSKGPSAEDVKRAEAMTPEARTAMIRAMVDQLDQRLAAAPRDAEGWIKLMRSRKVLGEDGAAKSARDKALSIFAEAPDEKERIAAAARELQIGD
ncbi:MAG: tetratricopeptide repeat protein [Hyphomicrobium sp.]